MPSVPEQIASFLRFLAHRKRRRHDDHAAADQHNWSNAGRRLPPGLSLQWLGTSGFRIAYGEHAILIDPYVTRMSVREIVKRRAVPPSRELIDRHLPDPVSAVLIGHTHFDHALDTPAIAARDGARVYGSRSLVNLMQLYGMAEQAEEVEPYRTYEIGPFEVTFVPSVHSKLLLGLKVPAGGDICCSHFDELVPSAYGCGQVWGIHIAVAGITFYHQGSADLIDDAVVHRGVDYFLAGIAGRGFTDDYTRRVLSKLEPEVVVPHHYDDFLRPLDAPMKFSLNVDLAGFMDEVRQVSGDFELVDLEPMQTVGEP